MNWKKLIANTGIAFFTSMVSLFAIDNVVPNVSLDSGTILIGAAIISSMHAALAFFRELSEEADKANGNGKTKKTKLLSHLLIL